MYTSNGAKVIGAGMGYSAEDRAFDRMLLGDRLAAMAAPQPSLGNESSGYLPFSFLARDGSGHFTPQNPVELFGRRAVAETSFGEGFKAQVSDTVSGAWAGIRNFGLDTADGWRGIRGTRSGFYRSVDEMGFAKTLVYYGAQATLAPWMTGGSIVDSGVRTAGNLSKGEMGAAGRSTAQFLESTSVAALSVVGGRQGLSARATFEVGERIAVADGFVSARVGNVDSTAGTSLAELRAKYGVNEENLKVEATFEHKGNVFYDVNQTARNPELATDGRLPIYSDAKASVGAPNQTYADAHAEIGAMAQSFDSGARSGSATLTIMGKDACSFCVSDVKRMALQLELDELTVIQPSGTITFTGPHDFAPIKLGGKKW